MKDQLSSMPLKQILGGRNLYLIGMMGSGKTLTGPLLAQQIDYGFVDSDEVIEKVTHKSIDAIFKEDGEKSFRDIETQVLKEIGQRYSLVVATGGGVVIRTENWGVLHQGIIIWIDPGRDRLLSRLQLDSSKRPLLLSEDPISAFDDLNNQREHLYMEADLRISVQDESPQDIARKIFTKLPSIITSQAIQDGQRTIEG